MLCFCSIKSGVDGRPLDAAHRVRMQHDAEFESEGRTIRCTEVSSFLHSHISYRGYRDTNLFNFRF